MTLIPNAPDPHERLLDAFLEEAVGGASPPDVSAAPKLVGVKVWREMEEEAANGKRGQTFYHVDALLAPLDVRSDVEGPAEPAAPQFPSVQTDGWPHRWVGRRRRSPAAMAIGLGVIGLGVVLACFALWVAAQSQFLAESPRDSAAQNVFGHKREVGKEKISSANQTSPKVPTPKTTPPIFGSQIPRVKKNEPLTPQTPRLDQPSLPTFGPKSESPQYAKLQPEERLDPTQRQRADDALLAQRDDQVIAFINHSIARACEEAKAPMAQPASDSQWCRRVYLRVVGRIPTVNELRRFLDDPHPRKRQHLVATLISGKEYAEEFARHWSMYWSNTLIGRMAGAPNQVGAGSLVSRDGFLQYLRRSLHENKPFNIMVYEMVSATGASQPGEPDYNGAVNFLLAHHGEKFALAAAKTAQVFLGKRLQCAQCHNHHSNSWSQQDFWAFNAFFRQMHVAQNDFGNSPAARLVNRDFLGEGRQPDEDDAEVYYEQPNGQLQVAYPVYLDGTALSHSGLMERVNRREQLAQFIAAGEDLSRVTVNRIWSHFLGFGFTQPVDDMGPHKTVSHPQLLQDLAKNFRRSGHDLKRLIKWIALSEPFALSSHLAQSSEREQVDAPEAGRPLFSRYYTRQMAPEEVYESLRLAARRAPEKFLATRRISADRERLAWLGQFSRKMATDEGEEIVAFEGGVSQSLMMMNGQLTRQAVRLDEDNLLRQVVQSQMTWEKKLEHLFLAALSRKPSRKESQAIRRLLQIRQKESQHQAAVLADVWWALLNSNEFVLDH